MSIELSRDQKNVLISIIDWLKNPTNQFLTVGGYAGTGKTTLIAELRKRLPKKVKVAFCAYTGKATRVMEQKLKKADVILENDSVSTIHSLIYKVLTDKQGGISGWIRKDKLECDFIIVDEASMVGKQIWEDLLRFKKLILAVGDHGQLAPVGDSFSLMKKPQLKLENIHRQAEGSAIIEVSRIARESGEIPVRNFSSTVKKLSRYDSDAGLEIEDFIGSYDENSMILCGYNNTRIRLNQQVRQTLGFDAAGIESGERLICLKNNHKEGLVNGQIGILNSVLDETDHHYLVNVSFEDTSFEGLISKHQIDSPSTIKKVEGISPKKIGNLFDRGYALTVHKAQGSQAGRVLVIEERFKQMNDEEWKKWLYTAVTRAENELLVIG